MPEFTLEPPLCEKLVKPTPLSYIRRVLSPEHTRHIFVGDMCLFSRGVKNWYWNVVNVDARTDSSNLADIQTVDEILKTAEFCVFFQHLKTQHRRDSSD